MVEKEGRKPKVEEELLKDGFMRPKDIVYYPSGMKRCTKRLKRCRWVSKTGRGRCYYNQYSYTEEGCQATPDGMTVFTCQTLILNHAPLGTLLSFLSDSQFTTLGCRSMWIVGASLVLPQDANVAAGKGKSHSAVPSPFLVSRSEPTAKAGRWLFGAMGTENAVGTCPWRPCPPRTKEVGDEVLLQALYERVFFFLCNYFIMSE